MKNYTITIHTLKLLMLGLLTSPIALLVFIIEVFICSTFHLEMILAKYLIPTYVFIAVAYGLLRLYTVHTILKDLTEDVVKVGSKYYVIPKTPSIWRAILMMYDGKDVMCYLLRGSRGILEAEKGAEVLTIITLGADETYTVMTVNELINGIRSSDLRGRIIPKVWGKEETIKEIIKTLIKLVGEVDKERLEKIIPRLTLDLI